MDSFYGGFYIFKTLCLNLVKSVNKYNLKSKSLIKVKMGEFNKGLFELIRALAESLRYLQAIERQSSSSNEIRLYTLGKFTSRANVNEIQHQAPVKAFLRKNSTMP